MSPQRPSQRTPLQTLATLCGIELTCRDGMGQQWQVSPETLRALLESMRISVETDKEIRHSLTMLRHHHRTKLVKEVIVFWDDEPRWTWELTIPSPSEDLDRVQISLRLINEQGETLSLPPLSGKNLSPLHERWIAKPRCMRVILPFPWRLSIGYYRLQVAVEQPRCTTTAHAWVLVAPRRCFQMAEPVRSWGITLQLYSLRSTQNWGIGDFRDLQAVAAWADRKMGAAMVGVNPLHALAPGIISPYSPSSRLFYNPLYLHVEDIEEFASSPSLARKIRSAQFRRHLAALRDSELVSYEAVSAVKWPLFESLYKTFRRRHLARQTARAKRFQRFVKQQGIPLQQFAVFEALREHFKGIPWMEWPSEYRTPTAPAVAQFFSSHQDRVQFHEYLQWQCSLQLSKLGRRVANMPYGIYQDLAVAIHPQGADAWMFQHQLATGVTVGAPPDFFNRGGQNWGLQPLLPHQLRATGYELLRETFRHVMQHGRLLRIDHAMGLFRLFWIPQGATGLDGAYVRYPARELLAVLAIESVRHQVTVIGEDLGTVTPVIRRRLRDAGLLSYRLLMFEKTARHRFKRPRAFPVQALVSVTTHDLPTLRGFWVGRDIEVKERAGLYPSREQAEQDRGYRQHDRQALLAALRREGLLPPQVSHHDEIFANWSLALCLAIYRYLARTPCRIVAIPLEDLLGELDTPNLPGAHPTHYPVWRRKLSRTLEDWQADPMLRKFAAAIHEERTRYALWSAPMAERPA